MIENQTNPTVIYTDQKIVYSSEIFFPAMTICPGLVLETPYKIGLEYEKIKTLLKNGQIRIENLSINILKRLQLASLIARDGFMSENYKDLSIPTNDIMFRFDDFPPFWQIKTGNKHVGTTEKFSGTWIGSDSILEFRQVLWKTGYCWTFNFPTNATEVVKINK